MGCIFVTRGANAVTQAVDLAPQFQRIRGWATQELSWLLGSLLCQESNSPLKLQLLQEKKNLVLRERIWYVYLIIHFIAWMLYFLASKSFLVWFSACFQVLVHWVKYLSGLLPTVSVPLGCPTSPLRLAQYQPVHKLWKRQQFCFWSNHKQFP